MNQFSTILLVEDEDPVRRLMARILGTRSYDVLEARHGEEALSVSEGYPGPIHLLVTDIMMPVMNGRELAVRLSSLRPGLPILFISGYPGNFMPEGIAEGRLVEYLTKPFKPDVLLSRVGALLKRRASNAERGGPDAF